MHNIINKKTYVLSRPGELIVQEDCIDLDKIKPVQLVAKTRYTVISPGTEIGAFKGLPFLRSGVSYPRLVGYCNLAEVISVGGQVESYAVGDLILTFQPQTSAFVCDASEVICKVVAEEKFLPKITSTYLYHLGYDALLKGDVKPGESVAIIGLGALGLATVDVCRMAGNYVIGISGFNHELGKRFGANLTLDKGLPDCVERIHCSNGERKVDKVIVTSNKWGDWQLALEVVRSRGTIIVMGFPGRGEAMPAGYNPLDSHYFYYKQLKLVACGLAHDIDVAPDVERFTVKRNMKYLVDQIISGRLSSESVVTELANWQQMPECYESLAERKEGLITSALEWS